MHRIAGVRVPCMPVCVTFVVFVSVCMHLFVCVFLHSQVPVPYALHFFCKNQVCVSVCVSLCTCVGGLALAVSVLSCVPSLSLSLCHLLVSGTPALCRA